MLEVRGLEGNRQLISLEKTDMVLAASVTDQAQRKRAVVQQAERIRQESGAWESP